MLSIWVKLINSAKKVCGAASLLIQILLRLKGNEKDTEGKDKS